MLNVYGYAKRYINSNDNINNKTIKSMRDSFIQNEYTTIDWRVGGAGQ